MLIAAGSVPVMAAETTAESPHDEILRWITATSAIINFQNTASPFLITEPRYYSNLELNKELLVRSWNIHNADDLREQVIGMNQGTRGQNIQFFESYSIVYVLGVDELVELLEYESDEEANRSHFEAIAYIGDKWGSTGILGWDLFRVGTLLSWGYEVGYIDHDEAVMLMEPTVRMLKTNFSSWEEAVENYLDGFVFWSRASFDDPPESFTLRHIIFQDLQRTHPEIFDDSLFTTPHIVGMQRIGEISPQNVAGFWRVEAGQSFPEGYEVFDFYFDDNGNVLTIIDIEEMQLVVTGRYRIDNNFLSISYYMLYEIAPNGDYEVFYVELYDSLLFSISEDGTRLIGIELVYPRWTIANYERIPEAVPPVAF